MDFVSFVDILDSSWMQQQCSRSKTRGSMSRGDKRNKGRNWMNWILTSVCSRMCSGNNRLILMQISNEFNCREYMLILISIFYHRNSVHHSWIHGFPFVSSRRTRSRCLLLCNCSNVEMTERAEKISGSNYVTVLWRSHLADAAM